MGAEINLDMVAERVHHFAVGELDFVCYGLGTLSKSISQCQLALALLLLEKLEVTILKAVGVK